MLGILASAALVICGALVLGQAVLRLCGANTWSWLAAPVGAAGLLLVAVPALHTPGRAAGTAVLLVLALAAAGVVLGRGRRQLPPGAGLIAGIPVAVLTVIPFAAAGRSGTLGWSFNNDMATHLKWSEAYRSQAVAAVNTLPADYPLGAHALAATLAELLGVGVDQALAGITMAAPVLIGYTALSVLSKPQVWGSAAVATLVGMPFLVAGYFGQGSFKELLQALFVLGAACWLAARPDVRPRLRWLPFALILAGTVSVYSVQGAAWPLAFLALWLIGAATVAVARGLGVRAFASAMRGELAAVAVGVGALLVVLVPQLPRLQAFLANTSSNGTGIAKEDLGNLAGRLPFWEALGIWGSADYRTPGPDPFSDGLWSAFALALVAFGVLWALRRREWLLVSATGAALLIWKVADRGQSPYIAAKALMMLSPLLVLLAVRPLAERHRGGRMPSWWWLAAPVLAAVLIVKALESSVDALRFSKVGPTAHTRELRALRPTLDGGRTLYLGNDDFIAWALPDVPVLAPVIGLPRLPFRAEKPWVYGEDYDVDSLDAATLNGFKWVIAPRDAAASAMPSQLRLTRRTRSFDLYRRTGTIPPRSILAEGPGSTAPLDCSSPAGLAIRRAGGLAAVRAPPVAVAVPGLGPGARATVELPLTTGTWDLVTPYTSERELRVRAPGLDTTLPANLDRPGPRWPIGRITVRRAGLVRVQLDVASGRLTAASAATAPGAIIAVPTRTQRTVPIAQACGKAVDWYRSAPR